MTRPDSSSRASRMRLLKLEPRILFDGALVADLLAVAPADGSGTDHAAEQPAATATTTDSAQTDQGSDAQQGSTASGLFALKDASDSAASTAGTAADTAQQEIVAFLSNASAQDLLTIFSGNGNQQGTDALSAAEALRQGILDGSYTINVELLDNATMQGAKGAFAAVSPDGSPVIYLNRDWIEGGADSASLTRVLTEEFGHYLDQQINGSNDTAGDEGELFADIIANGGQGIGSAAPSDDDHATFTVDDQSVAVELASYTFVNAYEITTDLGHVADKESNTHDFYYNQGATGSGLGQVTVDDDTSSQLFSGNDVSAIGINIGGNTYYGWISRPIKSQGIVRGFYFWTDVDFTDLATAQADGNQDGDADPTDNRGFLLVVDQAWFDAQNYVSGDIKNVGSSSDRVDSALNELVLANNAPVASPDAQTVGEGSLASGNVLSNDTDADFDTLSVTRFVVDGQSYDAGSTAVIAGVGTLSIGSDGAYSFTPVTDYSGSVPVVDYVVSDGKGATDTSTLTLTVTPANDPPEGGKLADGSTDPAYDSGNDQYAITTPEDTPIDGQVKAYDPDGDSLTYTKASDPANGSVTVNADGTYTYTPNPDYNGADQFTVSVSDGNGGTTTILVKVTVTPVNDAPTATADVATAVEAGGDNNATGGSHATADAASGVLGNDTDPENDTLTVDMVGTGIADQNVTSGTDSATGTTVVGMYGSLKIGADGSYDYTVNDSAAAVQALRLSTDTLTDTFTYRISDGNGGYSTATLTITIHGNNDNPVAANDYNVAKEHLSTADDGFDATGNVLTNDTDVDGTTYGEVTTIAGIGATATAGTITADAVTSNLLFSVSSGFTSVSDGKELYFYDTTTATYRAVHDSSGNIIYVVGSPTDTGTTDSTTGNSIYTVQLSGNPSYYLDGTSTSVSISLDGAEVGFKETGSPSTAETTTTSSMKTATVQQTVTVGGSTVTIDASTVTGQIAAGMSVSGDGAPAGTLVTDVNYDASGAVTSIVLNNVLGTEGATLSFYAAAGTTLTGQYGTLTLAANGSYTYTPDTDIASLNEGESAVEIFQYTMQDASGVQQTAVLQITVLGSGGTDPVAVADTGSVTENSATPASGNVLANDTRDTAEATVSSVSSVSQTDTDSSDGFSVDGLYGTLTLATDGTYTYTLDPNNAAVNALHDGETLTDTFQYQLNDPSGNTYSGVDAASLTITINGTNDVPVGGKLPDGSADPNYDTGSSSYIVTTPEDTAISGQVKAYDADDTTLTYSKAGDPAHGSVTVNADGTYTYTPNADYNGSDSFTVSVSDGYGGSATIAVTVNVTPVNDPPVLDLDGNNSSASGADYQTTYDMGAGGAVAIADTDDSVTDVDNATLSTATIVLTNAKTGDVLSVGDLSGFNISASATSLTANADGSLSLTLTGNGSATPADFAAALQAISFSTTSTDTAGRSLDITVNDGTADSNTAHTTIAMSPDSRALVVTGQTVNEASPYAVFEVGGADGQQITLALGSTGTSTGNAVLGLDTGNAGSGVPLQVLEGGVWVDYTPGSTVTISGSSLLVRTAIVQDDAYEGLETYALLATNGAGTAYTGTGGIIDDGTGALFASDNTTATPNDPTNASDSTYGTVLDDDRPVSVDSVEVNEGSPYAVFTVTGTAGQPVQLTLADGTATGAGTDYGPGLEYWDPSSNAWVSYTAGSYVEIPSGGDTLLVRTRITNDGVYEGSEYFSLTVTNGGGGSATGYGFINDDGTGTKFDGTVSGGTPVTDTSNLDDDRALAISGGGTVNEASPYAVFTVTGLAGNAITLDLGLTADATDQDADISGFTLQYSTDGSTWETYTWDGSAGSMPTIPASGTVYVRVDISSESDTVFEGTENFTLTAAYESNAGKTATGTASIVDDGTGTKYDGSVSGGTPATDTSNLDDDRSLAVDSITVNEGSPYAIFTVSGNAGQDVSLVLSDGTATGAGTDYGPGLEYWDAGSSAWQAYTGGTVTVPASGTLLVRTTITNDSLYEGAETFTLNAAYTSNTGNTASGTATIVDDGTGTKYDGSVSGGTPVIDTANLDDDRSLAVDSITVNEGSPYAVFTVSGNAGQGVSLALSDGTATGAGTDYGPGLEYWDGSSWQTYTGGTVTIPAGGTLLVRTTITNDSIYEGAETFALTVTSPKGPATGTATIVDDGTGTKYDGSVSGGTPVIDTANLDDDRSLAVDSITVNEGSAYAIFTVSGNAGQDVSLALSDGTATGAGTDYGPGLEYWDGSSWQAYTSGTVTIPAGGTLLVRTTITNDTLYEGAETFTLNAAYTSNTGSTATGTATIVDDGTGTKYDGSVSGGTPVIDTANLDDDRSLAVDSITVNEGSAYAVFTVSGNAGQDVSLALSDGTATGAGTDYGPGLEYWDGSSWQTYTGGTVTIPAGGTLLVRTTITNDSLYEGAETFTLNAAYTSNTGNTATGTATIVDDGTGTKYDGSVSGGTPATDTSNLDDDRPDTPATIGGTTTGTVTEDSGDYVRAGQLTVSDPDVGEAAFVAQQNVAGTYGSFSIDADGHWTYVADNTLLQPLVRAGEATEQFVVRTLDGTTQTITIVLNGVQEATLVHQLPLDLTPAVAPIQFTTGTPVLETTPALYVLPEVSAVRAEQELGALDDEPAQQSSLAGGFVLVTDHNLHVLPAVAEVQRDVRYAASLIQQIDGNAFQRNTVLGDPDEEELPQRGADAPRQAQPERGDAPAAERATPAAAAGQAAPQPQPQPQPPAPRDVPVGRSSFSEQLRHAAARNDARATATRAGRAG